MSDACIVIFIPDFQNIPQSIYTSCTPFIMFYVADGPCLIHSNTGDLLRSLDPPDTTFKCPKFIAMTREGYIIVNYDRGALVSYGINGKTLRHVAHNDNVQVRR